MQPQQFGRDVAVVAEQHDDGHRPYKRRRDDRQDGDEVQKSFERNVRPGDGKGEGKADRRS